MTNCSEFLLSCYNVIRSQLAPSFVPPKVVGMEQEFGDMYDSLKKTIIVRENTSMLVYGHRSCGKSILIQSVLNELERNEDVPPFISISIDSLLYEDDGAALKEIVRQLAGRLGKGTPRMSNYNVCMGFISQSLEESDRSVILVIDGIEKYVAKKQTFLYNLFNMTTEESSGLALIGMTHRVDLEILMEKRIKSRFSQRKVHLYHLAHLDHISKILHSRLVLPNITRESIDFLEMMDDENSSSLSLSDSIGCYDQLLLKQYRIEDVRVLLRCSDDVARFNDVVRSLIADPDVSGAMKEFANITGSIRIFLATMGTAICLPFNNNYSSLLAKTRVIEAFHAHSSSSDIFPVLRQCTRNEIMFLVSASLLHSRGTSSRTFENYSREFAALEHRIEGQSAGVGSSSKELILFAFRQLVKKQLLTLEDGNDTLLDTERPIILQVFREELINVLDDRLRHILQVSD